MKNSANFFGSTIWLKTLFIIIVLMNSCNEKKVTEKNMDQTTTENADSGKIENQNNPVSADEGQLWIENIFKCKGKEGLCFYVDDEPNLTTKRFYDFMLDSQEIFGASALTEEELPKAKADYEKKWSSVYPLRTTDEPWLFGRGQDDMLNIRNVKITKLGDLNYLVFVDYDGNIRTESKVTLVKENGSFKIDYSDTHFLE